MEHLCASCNRTSRDYWLRDNGEWMWETSCGSNLFAPMCSMVILTSPAPLSSSRVEQSFFKAGVSSSFCRANVRYPRWYRRGSHALLSLSHSPQLPPRLLHTRGPEP